MLELGSTGSPGDPIDIPIVPPSLPIRTSVIGNGVRKQPSLSMILSQDSVKKPMGRKMSIDEIEYEQCRLEPKIESRIVIINDEVKSRR